MIIFLATQVITPKMQVSSKLGCDKFLLSYFYLSLKNSAVGDNLIAKKELDRFLDFMTKRKGFKK